MEDENTSRYKDQPKNLGRGVQTAPERERNFGVQRPIWHFWSANGTLKGPNFPWLGFGPTAFE